MIARCTTDVDACESPGQFEQDFSQHVMPTSDWDASCQTRNCDDGHLTHDVTVLTSKLIAMKARLEWTQPVDKMACADVVMAGVVVERVRNSREAFPTACA